MHALADTGQFTLEMSPKNFGNERGERCNQFRNDDEAFVKCPIRVELIWSLFVCGPIAGSAAADVPVAESIDQRVAAYSISLRVAV